MAAFPQLTPAQQTEVGYAMQQMGAGRSLQYVREQLLRRGHVGAQIGLSVSQVMTRAAANLEASGLVAATRGSQLVCNLCPWKVGAADQIGIRVVFTGRDAAGNVVTTSIVLNADATATKDDVLAAAEALRQSIGQTKPSGRVYIDQPTAQIVSIFRGGLQGGLGPVVSGS